MEELEVSTEVYLPPEEVYDFLLDFPRYAEYSKHLREVRRFGDGGPGTEYDITFGWWKVRYTVRSRVTETDPPERIGFEIARGIRASGEWRIEPIEERADEEGGDTCRVHFLVRYDANSVAGDAVRLPGFVSLDWVLDRVRPKLREEAERIVERVVADLEGERRSVELRVET